jgi:hypothetical protein
MRANEEKELEKYFFFRARDGRVPSVTSMESYCKKKGLGVSRKFLRGLRYKFKFTAIFSQKRKPKHFMGMAIQRYGVLMLDRANYDYKRDQDELTSETKDPPRRGSRRKRGSGKIYKGN